MSETDQAVMIVQDVTARALRAYDGPDHLKLILSTAAWKAVMSPEVMKNPPPSPICSTPFLCYDEIIEDAQLPGMIAYAVVTP